MPSASRVFVVHVWAEDHSFHARARAADAEQPNDFDDPQALLAFLHHGSGPQPALCPPAAPAQTPNKPRE